ncbi:hypothetical protein FNV43_RR21608 [Rhamnella rubrinervis]|uniref:Uncharacterized protein n=1 Tax=Rhamnella rubrinervis TaxID=2594499 RepID=A0A8K0DUL1_9ROSA|nr:hypothetical protein FNV43_RR21608 [Rhamnella rubrinervis]
MLARVLPTQEAIASKIKVNIEAVHKSLGSTTAMVVRNAEGWIKVNIDAAHKSLGSAIAIIVRNAEGKLLFISSKLLSCRSSSFDAKVAPCTRLLSMGLVMGGGICTGRKRFDRLDWSLSWQNFSRIDRSDNIVKLELGYPSCNPNSGHGLGNSSCRSCKNFLAIESH